MIYIILHLYTFFLPWGVVYNNLYFLFFFKRSKDRKKKQFFKIYYKEQQEHNNNNNKRKTTNCNLVTIYNIDTTALKKNED
jgi:hypothetical protein